VARLEHVGRAVAGAVMNQARREEPTTVPLERLVASDPAGYAINTGLPAWGRAMGARNTTLTAVDLFSGCGGLTLGLKQAGFEVIGAVEVDELAASTYADNHEEVRLWCKDIRRLAPRKVRLALGLKRRQLHLLAGCPPCQGFSSLRTHHKSRSVKDDRNELIFRFMDYIREFRPLAVMLENVPGLANDERLAKFKEQLDALGYRHTSNVFDAQAFGVPQRRRRLILTALLGRDAVTAKPNSYRITVREVISGLPIPGGSGDPLHDLVENRTSRIRDLIRRIPKDGGGRRDLGRDQQLDCHKRCSGFYDIYGRMAWDAVAPTITSGCVNPSKGRFLHPEQDRAITLREAALLQGFPRSYKFSLERGKYPAAEMIGNAFPPPFVKRHAVKLRELLCHYGDH